MKTNKPAALGEKCDTFFENDFIKIDTQIIVGNNNPNYILPMNINGIMIETEGVMNILKNK